jgi:lysophospholipase L1-like esterase
VSEPSPACGSAPSPGSGSTPARVTAPARGLVAIGDSITHGAGEAMLGLQMQSWALWLAQALGMPFTCLAVGGARARDALRVQVPRLSGPYDLGCVYLGVNDARAPDWDAQAFRGDLEQVVAAVARQSRALLLLELPPTLGRPPAPGPAIASANRTIELLAERHGATVLELSSLRGGELVLPDAVHLTARGEAHVALLAARRLEQGGIRVQLRELHEALTPLRASERLRYLCGAHALAQLRDWRRRLRERA